MGRKRGKINGASSAKNRRFFNEIDSENVSIDKCLLIKVKDILYTQIYYN